MDKFVRKWNNKGVEDWGAYTSKEFNSFALQMKNALQRSLTDGAKVARYYKGHYDLLMFVEHNGNYVYVSYDVPRGGEAMDLKYDRSAFSGVLVRVAKNDKDYHGGHNHFCSMAELPKVVMNMITDERNYRSAGFDFNVEKKAA